MPELPEVETTRRGLEPHIVEQTVRQLVVRQNRLRWPVPRALGKTLTDQRILALSRRGKYLLFGFERGTLIVHLGMSGSLRVLQDAGPPGPHDHIDLALVNGTCLRYTDPRRFGAWLWWRGDAGTHPLLKDLGPEPLGGAFSGDYLFARARGRRLAVKAFLMDSHVVVGVGNIYANEALFQAGIHPARAAGRISRERYRRLAACVQAVLEAAIRQGGTTLRDFVGGEGRPGYFRQQLQVYGRGGAACPRCASALRETRIGQRSSVYCPRCQR